jgi:predicted DNA-binding protein (UPF0251 family)
MAADHGRARRVIGTVRRLGRRGNQAFHEPGAAQPDDIDQVPRLQPGKAHLDAPWAALDAYVKRAMVNTQISWWRRRRVEEFPMEDIPERAAAEHLPPSELQDTVRRALDRLPQRMRAAIVLRYYEDMSEPEIADALGVSRGTVKSTVSRAVAKLRIDAELAGHVPGGTGPAGH